MMNKRIKELANKAGFEYVEAEGIGWAGNYDASLPKFAELIIEDCMYAVAHDLGTTKFDYWMAIKERFGVSDAVRHIDDKGYSLGTKAAYEEFRSKREQKD